MGSGVCRPTRCRAPLRAPASCRVFSPSCSSEHCASVFPLERSGDSNRQAPCQKMPSHRHRVIIVIAIGHRHRHRRHHHHRHQCEQCWLNNVAKPFHIPENENSCGACPSRYRWSCRRSAAGAGREGHCQCQSQSQCQCHSQSQGQCQSRHGVMPVRTRMPRGQVPVRAPVPVPARASVPVQMPAPVPLPFQYMLAATILQYIAH